MKLFIPAFAVAVLSMSTSAFAFQGTATADVPLRSGPGPTHTIINTIDRNAHVEVEGCLSNSNWCQVTSNGQRGWVWGANLTTRHSGQTVVLTDQRQILQVPTVTYQEQRAAVPAATTSTTTTSTGSTGAAVGVTGGVIAGALLGGPVGAVIGGVVGLAGGAALDPPDTVKTYVTTNKVEPIYLDGEVVVGQALPKTVKVYEVPKYDYRYAYVNGRTVLVEPDSGQIVYVYR